MPRTLIYEPGALFVLDIASFSNISHIIPLRRSYGSERLHRYISLIQTEHCNLVLMPTVLPCFHVSSMKDVALPSACHIDWSIASDACSTRPHLAYALDCSLAY